MTPCFPTPLSPVSPARPPHSALRPAGAQAGAHPRPVADDPLDLHGRLRGHPGRAAGRVDAFVRKAAGASPLASPAPDNERSARRWVIGASAGSAGLLAVLLGADMLDRPRALAPARIRRGAHRDDGPAMVVGSELPRCAGRTEFAVSSELHVPVGRPVIVTLKSTDVIHTFWVPSLHGKKDMLPGRTTQLLLRADKPGTYRGECAEFCGLQHALMAFSVSADLPEAYARWRAAQQAPAAQPSEPEADAVRRQQLFLSSNCAQCHTVRGTAAHGHAGPRPHACGKPLAARRRHGAERARQARRVDRRSAVAQGRQHHAIEQPLSEPDDCARWSPTLAP
jgi:cytochrome c oxidase subunit 2